MGSANGGINAPEIHIRRHDEGHPLEKGIPGGDIFRRGLVLVFQRGQGQPLPVIRHRHNLQLHRACIVAGEQPHRELQAAVGISIEDQLCFRLVGLPQFGENIRIALPSKNKCPLGISEAGGLIRESGQLIRESYFTDSRADIMEAQRMPPRLAIAATRVLPQGLTPRLRAMADRNSAGGAAIHSVAVVKILIPPW